MSVWFQPETGYLILYGESCTPKFFETKDGWFTSFWHLDKNKCVYIGEFE
jgi:hypothetical protein